MSKKRNAEKTILVTGASAGIGKDAARTLAEMGYTVYAAARRLGAMEELRTAGVTPVQMDITKEEDILAVVEQIHQERGGIDILINNAGFGLIGSVEETPLEDARYQFDVNLFGLARLTQLALPYMREKKAGKIINVASVAGRASTPLGSWYVATKHALEGWSDCLRFELRQFNIDVVIVEPGAIATEFDQVVLDRLKAQTAGGPYANIADALARFQMSLSEGDNNSSPPSVITDVIVKAIRARRPKTRYVAGHMANFILFMRNWTSDRFYDWVLARTIGLK